MNGHLINGNPLCSHMDGLPNIESFQVFNDFSSARPIPSSMPDLSDIVLTNQNDTSIELMDNEYCPFSPPPMKSPKLNLDYILNSDKLDLSPTGLNGIDLLEAEILDTLLSIDKSIQQPVSDSFPSTPVVAKDCCERNVSNKRSVKSIGKPKFTESLISQLSVSPYESQNDSSRGASSDFSTSTPVVASNCRQRVDANKRPVKSIGKPRFAELLSKLSVQPYKSRNDSPRKTSFDSTISTRSAISMSRDFTGDTKCLKSVRVIIPYIGVDQVLSKKPKKGLSISPRGRNCNSNGVKNPKVSRSPIKRETTRMICCSSKSAEIRGITPEILAELISGAIVNLGKSRRLPSFPNPTSGSESALKSIEASVESAHPSNNANVWSPNDEKSQLLKCDPIVLSESTNEVVSVMEYIHRLKMSTNRCLYSKMAVGYQNTNHEQFELKVESVCTSAEPWKIHASRQLLQHEVNGTICKKGDLILITNLNLFGYVFEDSSDSVKVNKVGIRTELITLEVAKNEKLKEGVLIKIRQSGVCLDEYLRRIEILSLLKADNFFIKSICCPSSNYESENEMVTDEGKCLINECMRSIKSNKPSVQFLSGPAGSGKTKIIVDLLQQLLVCEELADENRNRKILVITKTEYSADSLCKRLVDSDCEKCYPVLRYCDSDRLEPALVRYARDLNQTSTSNSSDREIIIVSVDACYTAEFHRDFILTRTNEAYSGPIFGATIIDDANHANEDTLSLACVTAQKLVVVSGDTYFDENWFSQMVKKQEVSAQNVVRLTTQHRCHSKIRSCLNHLSGPKLVFPDNVISPKYKLKPVTIINFSTDGSEDLLEKSVVFGKLIAKYVVGAWPNESVGIVVATEKQADAIEGCFDSGDRIFFGLMDKFCGLERDVMIVCPAVQNDTEQFLYFAITRAKHSAIICGDFSKINARLLTQWADHRKSIIPWQEEPEKFPFSQLTYQN